MTKPRNGDPPQLRTSVGLLRDLEDLLRAETALTHDLGALGDLVDDLRLLDLLLGLVVELKGHPLGRETVGEEQSQVGDLDLEVDPDQVDGEGGLELAHELSAGAAGADELVGEVGRDGDGRVLLVALE